MLAKGKEGAVYTMAEEEMTATMREKDVKTTVEEGFKNVVPTKGEEIVVPTEREENHALTMQREVWLSFNDIVLHVNENRLLIVVSG